MVLPNNFPVHDPDTAELREITDPLALRALTHPVRLSLLEVLALRGPLTATAASDLVGESPTTCSFHFRQLAKYGFVEEAGRGPGRTRPWRLAHLGFRFHDAHDDPEASIASQALENLFVERAMSRLRHFETTKSTFSTEWQDAADTIESLAVLTPSELSQLSGEFLALVSRYGDRLVDAAARPEGSRAVELLFFGYPLATPGADE